MSGSGYRRLLSRRFFRWVLVATAGKVPIAMASIGMVFLVRELPGGYTLGASLAATYVLGEVVGAPVLGLWLTPETTRRHLALGMLVGAAAFGGLVLARTASPALLVICAFFAGAGPAASPGGLRTLITSAVPDQDAAPALSVEAALTQTIWAAAPGLVVLMALRVGPGAPLLIAAGCAVVAALLLVRMPPGSPRAEDERHARPLLRSLAAAWPIYVTSAASMALLASAELALPALLEYRQLAVGWAGPLLMTFSIVTAAGSLCYGLRTWPGSPARQTLTMLGATSVAVLSVAVLPGLPGIWLGLLCAGLLQAGTMVARNLWLRERLPGRMHTAGYSIGYAVQGAGYSVTATTVGLVLSASTPPAAVLCCVAIALLLVGASAVAASRANPRVRVEA
ncbi:MFS transporter [Amycolatopsis vancoresmycina]|uniref:Major facilitator transporter n=1 Tax=Amycolatopsis vancoresmycina DSM 44592 TaxID=1292037 RepID=R1I223_9PSEU|nr:MFS transporter [Amycolatopsis vancoresmycina]EOD66576.1 hypothetical protein H480_20854 [Amycolatopsis vancoresmycina DSM 44592]